MEFEKIKIEARYAVFCVLNCKLLAAQNVGGKYQNHGI